jgi:hypothetical protein
MDFFERWFHFSPDGGNGMLEAAYVIALAAAISVVVLRRRVQSYFRHPARAGKDRPS